MVTTSVNKLPREKYIRKYGIDPEDAEIINSLQLVKESLAFAHNTFDVTTDRALLDSAAYEIMSLNKKYEYYLRRCKERGLVAIPF